MLSEEQLKSLLIEYGVLSEEQIEAASQKVVGTEDSLADVLVLEGLMRDEELGQLLADRFSIPFVRLNQIAINSEVLTLIPEIVARHQNVIAFEMTSDELKITTDDPSQIELFYLLSKKAKRQIHVHFSTKFDIENALLLYKKDMAKVFDDLVIQYRKAAAKTTEENEEAAFPIIEMVDNIIQYAYQNSASDIHIEPHEKKLYVRFRMDGVLHDMLQLPKELMDMLVTRIKIMAKMRTDEHMAAMDGKISFLSERGRTDIRISVIPITNGEKVVMRLMPEKTRQHTIGELGFSKNDYDIIMGAIKKPHGMILATGPTGSGKTTTLYAVLKELDSRDVNIATIEDPVEYEIDGVNQIQVNSKTNLTFAKGLRSILRQDPDIIMVGEIRDEETAHIAINAAMTGHLVLSTLHTNDAATTLPRLIDMNVEPFLIASSVQISIAQRLVRKICTQCIQSYSLTRSDLEAQFPSINFQDFLDKSVKEVRLYKGAGCHVCNSLGYKGRVGIFEILEVQENIRNLIMEHANSDTIRDVAIKENGMHTLLYDALSKALRGLTTLEEVLRVAID